jgi:predicted O-methyltransferase YrrM
MNSSGRMQTDTKSSIGRAATGLVAVPFYLVVCSATQPRRAIEFLRNVYRFHRAEQVYNRDRQVIRTIRAEELFPSIFDTPVKLTGAAGQQGSLTCFEVYFLASLSRLLSARMVFEIGTFEGRTTLNMALNCAPEGEVYTIDLPSDDVRTKYERAYPNEGNARKIPVGGYFHNHLESGKIKQLWGDSASHDFERYYGKVDLVLIDGDHSYEYVKSDSEQALRMINSRGVVAWHDYDGSWRGVASYLRELASTRELCHIEGTSFVVTCPQRVVSSDVPIQEARKR